MLRMTRTPRFTVVIVSIAFLHLTAAAQQRPAAPRPSYDGSDSPLAPEQIRLDQDCNLLPDPAHLPLGKKVRLIRDDTLCHLENIAHSEHIEEKIVGDQMQRTRVKITEHEFVLQNVTNLPVLFVIQQPVPEGWMVDSDPQPSKIVDGTAIFPAHAQPGEIVHLHVGMRHTTSMKPKSLKQ